MLSVTSSLKSIYLAVWGAETAALENLAGKTQLGKWGKSYFEKTVLARARRS